MLNFPLLCSGRQPCAGVPLFAGTRRTGFTAGICFLEKERDLRTSSQSVDTQKRETSYSKEVGKQEKSEDKLTANCVFSSLKLIFAKISINEI